MRSPLTPTVATFEDNPIGGLSTGELLLAVAVVGAVGLGIYYATRPKTAIATTPAAAGIIRPNVIGNTFNSSSVAPVAIPAGAQLTVVNGQQLAGFALQPAQYITLILPPGATWMAIKIGSSPAFGNPISVDLGSDLTSPVSIPASTILAAKANVVVPTWQVGASGSQQAAFYGVFVT